MRIDSQLSRDYLFADNMAAIVTDAMTGNIYDNPISGAVQKGMAANYRDYL